MKFGIKLNNIELGDVKIGGIEINTEFSINEMVAIRKETEHILANAPKYIEQLANAVITFENIDNQMEKMAKEEQIDRYVNEAIHNANMKAVMELFAQG